MRFYPESQTSNKNPLYEVTEVEFNETVMLHKNSTKCYPMFHTKYIVPQIKLLLLISGS